MFRTTVRTLLGTFVALCATFSYFIHVVVVKFALFSLQCNGEEVTKLNGSLCNSSQAAKSFFFSPPNQIVKIC